ncbi:iron ABC transporter substrate-binding protein [Pseudomonas oryzihabitans]|nr:iron ABC transporter substrate-binding protein [Pseudomonas psychrotolerans]KTT40565.1 iron ABC transporter substrate-binding protein [Pseudomonas psychrotolerans]KTT45745.1 iron ABC transporter substrate-binding protein [Pseudomonas psychrotolerans]KTT63374.1 iron ABC transporter substrate-binding protein [Pseudomonas psychrotolerans]
MKGFALGRQWAARLVTLIACFLIAPAFAETRQVTDALGRTVTLEVPAKRVVLGFHFADYLAVGGEQGFASLVGISRGAWERKTPGTWREYVAKLPSLAELPDVGEVETNSFSVEKVLSLKPDVVVLAAWQFQALDSEVKRLAQLGIPVVVIDYNAQTLERHLASTRLLGVITGQEARAAELADFYAKAVEQVQTRIAAAQRPKPRVYAEFGNKGPAEYSFTYGQNMWGALVTLAGGDNIAAPFVQWWGVMNPEQVLLAQPQVIFISGREDNSNPSALPMGPGVTAEDARSHLRAFMQRPGWANLPAIRDGRLYGVYHGASRSLEDFAMLQFIAKQLYPDLFQDLDPMANYREYYRRYLPIQPQGTFAIGLAP